MKKVFLIKGLLLVMSLCILMSGCIPADGGKDPDDTQNFTPSPTVKHYYLETQYTYSIPIDESLLTTGLDGAYLLLANKQWSLGERYVPADLADIPANLRVDKQMQLDARALGALQLMMAEMSLAGINNTRVTSAYRSYVRQMELYSYYLEIERSGISGDAQKHFGEFYIYTNYTSRGLDRLTEEDANAVVLSYSAYPGTSEHQSGLCVDFITDGMSDLDVSFETYEVFTWLSQNAYRFGFILRYPRGKETTTGYTYEPWHYRFVGREAATDIYFSGLTLEEYLGALGV